MLDKFGLIETNAKAVKVNESYGRLTIKAVGQIKGSYKYYAVCECSCGSGLKRIRIDSIISGSVVSCGCSRIESILTHGLSTNPHYGRWRGMIERCENEKCASYKNYGGRGISVCEEWRDVRNFLKDMEPNYFEGAELDRIDNDGNYEPENVRWATRKANCGNRRTTRNIKFNGVVKPLSHWAAAAGINNSSMTDRIDSESRTLEQALTDPKGTRRHKSTRKEKKPKTDRKIRTVKYKGKPYTLKELSVLTGISVKLLSRRIFERNWSVERAAETNILTRHECAKIAAKASHNKDVSCQKHAKQ